MESMEKGLPVTRTKTLLLSSSGYFFANIVRYIRKSYKTNAVKQFLLGNDIKVAHH